MKIENESLKKNLELTELERLRDRILQEEARMARAVEALLFASVEPLSVSQIADRLPDHADIRGVLNNLQKEYEHRGVNLREINGKYAFRTSVEAAPYLAGIVKTEIRPLNRSAREILGVIAYYQPVTRAEIEEVRGCGVGKGTLDLLVEMKWVKPGKRRESPGRPVTFITTDIFLDHFGLSSIKDLPGLRELKEAGFLDASAVTAPGEEEMQYAERVFSAKRNPAFEDEEEARQSYFFEEEA